MEGDVAEEGMWFLFATKEKINLGIFYSDFAVLFSIVVLY